MSTFEIADRNTIIVFRSIWVNFVIEWFVYPLSGSNSSVLIFCPWISTTIEHTVSVGLHKTIKPLSVFTKYQFPVIQSIRKMSTAVVERKRETQLKILLLSCWVVRYKKRTRHFGNYKFWPFCTWKKSPKPKSCANSIFLFRVVVKLIIILLKI